ncbi:LysM peptidoglycan-binding domain-containing protein [Tissierella creatinini]|nr:LysM peptidoglycan-binding domain-containing protein [Tissierella creatinini]TJX69128.1 LysM peptidoglycan-binding domain-containing protein [Soehngenia saccharolytica]
MKNKKYLIVDVRRFFLFITAVFILISLIINVIFAYSKAYGSIQTQGFKEYYVDNGENLWNISLEYMPEGYDVRKMVFDIKRLNGMDTSFIVEGETIKIPIYDN